MAATKWEAERDTYTPTETDVYKGTLDRLDVLDHSDIRFATNAPHCTLYSVNWPSLEARREIHWLMLVYILLVLGHIWYSLTMNKTRFASL